MRWVEPYSWLLLLSSARDLIESMGLFCKARTSSQKQTIYCAVTCSKMHWLSHWCLNNVFTLHWNGSFFSLFSEKHPAGSPQEEAEQELQWWDNTQGKYIRGHSRAILMIERHQPYFLHEEGVFSSDWYA